MRGRRSKGKERASPTAIGGKGQNSPSPTPLNADHAGLVLRTAQKLGLVTERRKMIPSPSPLKDFVCTVSLPRLPLACRALGKGNEV